MLAARDQENLVHGHQAAAAAKPLNQGVKQLAPKTPGNKVPKTPFKVPLNDENGPAGFGGGKTVLKMGARGNENLMTVGKKGGLGDKNAFVTPLGMTSSERFLYATAETHLRTQDQEIEPLWVLRLPMPEPKHFRHPAPLSRRTTSTKEPRGVLRHGSPKQESPLPR